MCVYVAEPVFVFSHICPFSLKKKTTTEICFASSEALAQINNEASRKKNWQTFLAFGIIQSRPKIN